MQQFVPLVLGLLLFAAGALITCFNLYNCLLRYPLHRWRGGAGEDFRHVSGIPVVGIVFLLFAAACLNGHPVLMWTALVLAALDPSGPHWVAAFLIYMLIRPPQRRDGA